MRIPLAELSGTRLEDRDERLFCDESYEEWKAEKAPRIPPQPPSPILDDPESFLRRIRA